MKRVIKIFSLFAIILVLNGCQEPIVEANFEDMESMTIYDFIVENDSLYGTFLDIMNAGGIAKTMSAYNPYAEGYTLFLPDSLAVVDFIANSTQYNTLDDLLNDKEYCAALSRYHIVDLAIDANDFPFGALPTYTLSKDFLTINFVIETDTSYFKVNNQAPVSIENIEVSNGFVHVISKVLIPITFTTYKWINQHEGFTIFKEAVEATGFEEILSINMKDEDEETELDPVTMLLEPDSIFNKFNIYSFDDLVARISPDDEDYTDKDNPLYNFVGYHILDGSKFLDDFSGFNSNYTTYSQVPVNVYDLSIDNEGFDLAINKEKFVFDTIFQKEDTILIDYVKFLYDESNVLTQSGAIHFIDQMLEQQPPTRKDQWFSFWEEPLLNEYRKEPGEYIIEDTASLDWITWSGTDLTFIKSSDEEYKASNQDYIYLNGDFSVSYTIPKVVQGEYTLFLHAERFNVANALVEVFLDGKKIGGLIDLSDGGSADWPYRSIELGDVNFPDYSHHTITVTSLIPGRFCWDQVHIEPLINEYEDEK